MTSGARNLLRLGRVLLILARHRALFPLKALGFGPLARLLEALGRLAGRRPVPRDAPEGERLATALTALGPSFIKLGQTLATRPDLIGEDLADSLSALQDRLTPFAADEARATIERVLGSPIDRLFTHFEDTPVAAASIAQVHFAVTTEGEDVAVKVLRPGIETAFARDLSLMHWLAGLVLRLNPRLARLKPRETVATFAHVVAMEMDLRMEAAAASEMRENFTGDPRFQIPAIDWQRTGQRVLTLSRVSGIPIDERERILAAGLDPDLVLKNAADALFLQVFRDGLFHADLHPGNLFVAPDGALQAVDFGIVGRIDPPTRRYLGNMLLGFLEGDYGRVADVHFEAGYIPADQPRDEFMQACRAIGEPILGRPLSEISLARLLGQLFAVTETFQMETQPQLLLLQKTMMVAEGIGRRLNPDINMWELARPLIEDWIRDSLTPETLVLERLRETGKTLGRLPRLLARLEEAAETFAAAPKAGAAGGAAEAWRRVSSALWAIAGLLAALLVFLLFTYG